MVESETLDGLKAKFAKALEKSWKVNPEVHIEEQGKFRVQGSSSEYEVWIGRTERDLFFLACTCRGALEGNACYHGAKALVVYEAQVKVWKDARVKYCEDCGHIMGVSYSGEDEFLSCDKPDKTQCVNFN